MILDSSAIFAILTDEPEASSLGIRISNAASIAISAATLVESHVVMRGRYGDEGAHKVDSFLQRIAAQITSVDEYQARVASDAYRRYGRGSGHAAKLNYGDCFSYALAVAEDRPLLFKGDDFVHTDVRNAILEG